MPKLTHSTFDVWLVAFFGAIGCAMRLLEFQPAPLLPSSCRE